MKPNLLCQLNSIAIFLLSLYFQQASAKVMTTEAANGRDCTEIFAENPDAGSGVYLIKPEKVAKPFKVFCEKREDGGWTIFQRRHGKGENGQPVNFMRVWDSYKRGFGHVAYEHWLGLDYINALSQQPGKVCQLRVDMMSCKEELTYVLYDTFKIGNESELYQISLGNFTGNVGDAFRGTEEFGDQNGHNFSTYDRDNDGCNAAVESCGKRGEGGALSWLTPSLPPFFPGIS
ncbi:angiopoietin-related protein 7-like isoform 2-T3 [Macrochelys suwanniensis]